MLHNGREVKNSNEVKKIAGYLFEQGNDEIRPFKCFERQRHVPVTEKEKIVV
jgi:hypothetical protein